ncbi:MAG TPA: rhomboid family intramembrane serine protease [Planctomycetota bacterium]|nr:rhomboid family intramembrane serine protease [Planctomycetota bacterium]
MPLNDRPVTTGFVAALWIVYVLVLLGGGMGDHGGLGALGPSDRALDAAGSLDTEAVFAGEWERMATAALLHLGLLHILWNASALLQLGGTIERIYSSRDVAFVFAASAFGGSGAALAWTAATGEPKHVVGASGVACGAAAALWILWMGTPDGVLADYRSRIQAMLVINLAIGAIPGISFLGHAGGALAGAGAGLLIRRRGGVRLRGDGWTRGLDAATAILAGAFVVAVAVAAWKAPDRFREARADGPFRSLLTDLHERIYGDAVADDPEQAARDEAAWRADMLRLSVPASWEPARAAALEAFDLAADDGAKDPERRLAAARRLNDAWETFRRARGGGSGR